MVSVRKGQCRRVELPLLVEKQVEDGFWNIRLKHIPKTDRVEWKAWRVVNPRPDNPKRPREAVKAKRRTH